MGKKSRAKKEAKAMHADIGEAVMLFEKYSIDPTDVPWPQEGPGVVLTKMFARAIHEALRAWDTKPGEEGLLGAVQSLDRSTDSALGTLPTRALTTDGWVASRQYSGNAAGNGFTTTGDDSFQGRLCIA